MKALYYNHALVNIYSQLLKEEKVKSVAGFAREVKVTRQRMGEYLKHERKMPNVVQQRIEKRFSVDFTEYEYVKDAALPKKVAAPDYDFRKQLIGDVTALRAENIVIRTMLNKVLELLGIILSDERLEGMYNESLKNLGVPENIVESMPVISGL